MEELLDVNQAAKTLCVSPRTVWTLTNKGVLPSVKIGRRVLYAPDDIRAFIDISRQGGDNVSALAEAI